MYLKSIEVQGFKSFANKILFEFQDGITGIVGPNGSGKSNVADAVRWVLGEQSAKQLRGSNMQDIIFAGTETRKPLGFAYVSITMDNADHRLPIAYDEVTVARRVYRSGESEYLMNGTPCRLRDVQELFMDTGVGKEGYSIIGQGQIDKILSGKPEDRRELFDEAAGIVKYKRRKALAEKNLEEEKLNLSRVNDILTEIERQIGPLEKQSAVAKEYLLYKNDLKCVEVNQFLIEYDGNRSAKDQISDKLTIAGKNLSEAHSDFERVKSEYDELEKQLERYSTGLENGHIEKGEIQVNIEKCEGTIKLLEEQLAGISLNESHFMDRLTNSNKAIETKKAELSGYEEQKSENDNKLLRLNESQQEVAEELRQLKQRIEDRVRDMDGLNSDVFRFLNTNSEIKSQIQRLETLREQNTIKKSELNKNMLANKNDEAVVLLSVNDCTEALKNVSGEIIGKSKEQEKIEQEITSIQGKIVEREDAFSKKNQEYMTESSKLESLKNIAERYDGYGNSIRKVMEQKESNKNIHGVVADLITVDIKYETAIETALGNNIQNIVTEDEDTAKVLIEMLKNNKYGRATFLPLTSMEASQKEKPDDYSGEPGVIGYAGTLINADTKYRCMVNYLLGRILVVDTIDHAIALEKKHKYSLRVVTLEGEYMTPGGSISGGAYRNASNLLGRKREIEEREEALLQLQKEAEKVRKEKDELRECRAKEREKLEQIQRTLQELYVKQNTAKMNLNQEEAKLREIRDEYSDLAVNLRSAEVQLSEFENEIQKKKSDLQDNLEKSKQNEDKIGRYTKILEQEQEFERTLSEQAASLRIEGTNYQNTDAFLQQNMERVRNDLCALEKEQEDLSVSAADFEQQKQQRKDDIQRNHDLRKSYGEQKSQCEELIREYTEKKEEITKSHKKFFQHREELSATIGALDKEVFRLQSQAERLEEQLNTGITYMWDEYALTPSTAAEQRSAEYSSATKNRKLIGELRGKIKSLGDVNVNAIEEFKVISERHIFLSGQRKDILAAEETLVGIINDLDSAMRKQFEEEFIHIREQFDLVFKELFGGGKGTLELTEEENVLEAGIRIIAQPPGKKLQNMMQLSGGEKALTAIALLFAIQNLKPSPFCLVDEIEAALDDSNVKRFAKYLHKLTRETQFIVITHRRGTMAAADRLYGITMQEKGVSALVSVSLIEGELDK